MIDTLLVDPTPSEPNAGRAALRQAVGRDLPDAYLTWVERFGGSSIATVFPMPDVDGNAVLSKFDSAEDAAAKYVERTGFASSVPRDFIAVGYGPGGGVCIRIVDDRFGSVWFADYDLANQVLGEDGATQLSDDELPQIMTALADDWSAFIASRS